MDFWRGGGGSEAHLLPLSASIPSVRRGASKGSGAHHRGAAGAFPPPAHA